MRKAVNGIASILGLISVCLLTGCGVTSTSLPSNLQPGGGGFLSITTTQFPDAISGRSYSMTLATTGGSGILSSCQVATQGSLPSGLNWSISPLNPADCTLSGSAVGVSGSYSIVVTATDTSNPPKQASLPYTLVVRTDFSICTGPTSAVSSCSASSSAASTTTFPNAVVGRTYGVSPLSQIVQTNLNTTADSSPVGHANEAGNGPFTTATVTGLPPGVSATEQASQSNFVISGNAVSGPAQTYTVTVMITDNPIVIPTQTIPVVPARTLTKTYTFAVGTAIQLSLAQSLGNNWPDAVHGRAYGSGAGCTGGNCAAAVYTATGGIGTYNWPSTTPASVAAITGMSCVASGATYTCSATNVTAAPATPGAAPIAYTPTVAAADVGNTATPGANTTTDPNSSLTATVMVDPPLGVTLSQNGSSNPAALLPGVVGRSYGVIGVPPTYAAAGGLGAGALGVATYEWCVSAGALPTGFAGIGASCSSFTTTAAGTETLTDALIPNTVTPGTFNFTVEVADTGNTTTPSSIASSTSATNASSLVVNPMLLASVTQSTNATPAASLLDGVVNRSYGAVATTLATAAPPIYSATGGLPNASGAYLWCISAGSLPAGLTGVSATCGATASTASATAQLSASTAAPISATPGAYTFTVQADDGGNPAVPSTFVVPAAGSMVGPSSVTIHPQITLAQSLGAVWPDAVSGRSYGSAGSGCTGGACTPAVYSATSGLGNYVWPTTTPTSIAAVTGLSCAVVGVTYSCGSPAINAAPIAAGAAAVLYNPSATVTDTANAATPAATSTSDPNSTRTDKLWVDAPLLATLTQGTSTNPSNLLPGVTARSYGTIGAPPTYTAAGGLGSRAVADYEWCVNTPATLPAGFAGISVNCAAPTAGMSTETLTAANVTQVPTAPPSQNFSFTVELDDTGNTATPASNVSATSGISTTALLINSALSLAVSQTTNATASAALLPAVTNRSYGVINAGAGAPTFTASYGLGSYSFAGAPTGLGAGSGFGCSSTTANPLTCSANPVTLASSGTAYPVSLTVNDAANAAVPSGNTMVSTTLPVTAQIQLNQSLGANWPDAVNGRAYGSGANCTGGACAAAVYAAASGLGGYVWPAATPASIAGITGMSCAVVGVTYSCGAADITAAPGTAGAAAASYSPSATVTDTANEATPAATVASDPNSTRTDTVFVDSPLLATLTQGASTNPANLLPGVSGRSYGTIGAAPTYAATGGLGSRTVTDYEWCVQPAHPVPAGLAGISATCATPTTGAATETLTSANMTQAVTPPATNYPFTVELDDSGNASTPSSAATSTSAVNATALVVNAPLGLALAQTTNPTPTTALLAAVTNRSYGVINAGGGAPTYTASDGLGGYVFPASPGPYTMGGFNCATTATTYACAAATLSASAATYNGISLTVHDTANAAVPQGSTSVTTSLPVTAQIQLNQSLGANWPDAVNGRAYGSGANCTGGACAAAVYAAASGLGGYVWPAATPASIAGITGMSCAVVGVTYSCGAADITAAPGTAGAAAASYSPSATVTDTANEATPAATVASDPNSTRTDTVFVDSPLLATLTQGASTNPANLLPGVSGRSYGTIGAAPTYAATGGLGSRTVTDYEWCVQPAHPVPAGLAGISATCATPTTGAATETLTSANMTQAVTPPATNYPFAVELDDTGNTSTPSSAATATSALNSTALLVNAPLALALAQTTNATPTTALLAAVTNRSYGVINAGGGAPTYTASNGLGGYVFPTSPGPYSMGGFNCTPTATTYACSAATLTAAAATYNGISLTVHDTANAAVPQGTSSASTSLLVNSQIQLNQSLGANWPDAVNGRAYGSGANCTGGACTAAVYSATNGLGTYVWPGTTPASISGITGMSCSVVGVTYSCSAPDVTAAPATPGTAAVSYSPSATVTDTANEATPAATVASDPNSARTDTVFVDSPLLATLTQGASTNPANLLPGVSGRSYGTIGAAPTYAATGGLGARTVADYEWCANTGTSSLPAGLTGVGGVAGAGACTVWGPTGASTATLTSANITQTILPSASTNFHFTVELDDTGNASTPKSVSDNTFGQQATALLVNAPLTVTDTAYPGGLPAAVVSRDYGVVTDTCAGPAPCKSPLYTVTYGLGGYTFGTVTTANAPGGGAFPTGFTCTTAATTDTCHAAIGAAVTTAAAFSPTVSVSDTANAAVPSGNASTAGTESLTVHPALAVSDTALPGGLPDGVVSRDYGVSLDTCSAGPCKSPVYTATNGLGSYVFSPITTSNTVSAGAFPTGFSCVTNGPPISTDTCSATIGAGVSAPATFTPTVTVADTADAATPNASVTSSGETLLVHQPISVSDTNYAGALPDGVAGRDYGLPTDTCAGAAPCRPPLYTATNGLGGFTFAAITTAGTAGANVFPTGFACVTNGPPITTDTCDAAPIGAAVTTSSAFTPAVTVSDAANTTTPSGSATSTGQSLTLHAALKLTPDAASADPPPQGVVGRQYGDTALSTCGATSTTPCQDLIYDAVGGLGTFAFGTDPTSIASPGTGVPAAVTCAHASNQETCTTGTGAASLITATAGAYNFSVTVDDAANVATPDDASSSKTGTLSKAITINNQIAFNTGASCGNTPSAVCIGGASYTAAQAWPVAVTGRPYGAGTGCVGGSACVAPIYTATGGLGAVGGYTFPTVSGFPANITCTTTSPTLTCATPATGTTTVTAGAGTFSPSVTALDAANASTPAAVTTGCPAAGITCTDPNSILATTNVLTVNSELAISNTFLENGTVGEPYSAVFSIVPGDIGLGGPYRWCLGAITNATCPGSPAGGIPGVSFVTPNPAISDDPPAGGLTNRGYYQGTPNTTEPSAGTAGVFQVSDSGNNTTPGCSYISTSTCPSLTLTATTAPKVFLADGFVAANNSGINGNGIFGFDVNTFANAFATEPLTLDALGKPIVPRVTPDGNWVYVTEYGLHKVAVVDTQLQTKALSTSITTADSGVFGPWSVAFEPQQYFAGDSGNLGVCASGPCSNLAPVIRYDGWVTDPTAGGAVPQGIEPLPDAENPANLPASLAPGNDSALSGIGFNIGASIDGTQSFVTGTGTAIGGGLHDTLAFVALPNLTGSAATTYPGTTPGYFALGNNGQTLAVDPRGNYVYSVNFDNTATYSYVGVTTTGNPGPGAATAATPAGVGPNAISNYLPSGAGPAGTVNICTNNSGVPTSLAVSPEGNRLFVLCHNDTNGNEVDVWNVSQADGSLLSADATAAVTTPVAMIPLPLSQGNNAGAGPTNIENGCTFPFDVEAKLTNTTYGTRLYVSCWMSDTVVPIEYNSGSSVGTALDAFVVDTIISTDATPISNAVNATTAYTTTACGDGGSCPQVIGLEPNPVFHFVTGGNAPGTAVALPAATASTPTPYYQYVAVAGGAILPPAQQTPSQGPYTWSNPDGILGSDANCAGLTLSPTTGQITGTPTGAASATCGTTAGGNGFIVRVTDATGQFVERTFKIPIQ